MKNFKTEPPIICKVARPFGIRRNDAASDRFLSFFLSVLLTLIWVTAIMCLGTFVLAGAVNILTAKNYNMFEFVEVILPEVEFFVRSIGRRVK